MSISKLKVMTIASAFSVMSFSLSSQISFAQNAIAPDNTLLVNTSVNFNITNKTYTITGGTQVGTNQFHSFQDFSVPTSNTAHFDTLPTTVNAIGRVTGLNISNIDGLIKANGTTNLYLINPNGIIFGKDAKLEIGGSFGASTANSFKFPDGSEFSATNPQAPPLLNVNVPLGLQYGTSNTGATISNQGNLEAGQDLVLNADKLDLQGTLGTFGSGRNLTLQAQDSILVTNGAKLSSGAFGQGNAGSIEISTKTLELLGGSSIDVSTLGQGDAGTVKITATESIKFDGKSFAISVASIEALGNAGGVEISTKTLELLDGSFLSSDTFGQGDAGTVKITATGSIKFDASSVNSSVSIEAVGNAGGVEISTKTLELLGRSSIDANTFGQGDAGTVKITATESIKFDGNSSAKSEVKRGAVGNAGGVEISTKTLELLGGSLLDASTFGQGNAGTVKITATELIKFDGNSSAFSAVEIGAVGNAGGVEISTKTLGLLGVSLLDASTRGLGDAGTVKITATESIKFDGNSFAISVVNTGAVGKAGGVEISTKTLELLGGSGLSSSTFGQGNAGTVKITATESIKFDGNSSAISAVETGAVGNAGGVEISTKTLELLGGTFLDANTFGQGNAGTLKITATESIKFDGNSSAESAVKEGAVGNAGGVEISAKTLELLGRSSIDANTFGQGDAGTIKITAIDSIKLTNGSSISSSTSTSGDSGRIEIIAGNSLILDGSGTGIFAKTEENSTGKGGSIFIDPPLVSITNGARIAVDSLGKGNGGDLTIIAGKFVFENNSFIRANTASGEGGNINLQITDIFFPRNNSSINATAGGTGNGGNINLSALFTIAIPSENNDIFANASFGKGGDINLTTQAIFGLQFRPSLTFLSDITASSEFGLQGNVNINTPGVDPSKGLTNLPANISDASKLVTQKCLADRQGSAFVITGRGGIPVSPADVISGNNLQENLGIPTNQLANQSSQLISQSPNPQANRIIEAQGWTINQQGQVSLVAEVPNAIPTPTWARQLQCR